MRFSLILALALAAATCTRPVRGGNVRSDAGRFHVVEATIEGIHRAIKNDELTCTDLVKAYISRAKAYNGVCTQLVTKDGAPVAPATGATRAGSPLVFPTRTVAASTILPNLAEYRGLPLDLGRMEATASDPTVQQQFGMRVGIPDAGQLNALSTINIRGERSVTCKSVCDAHPSTGALPAQCPSVCEAFRRQPDALERAAELDEQFGRHPDLKAMPMYCVPFAFKDPFDTRDMRTTGGGDIDFAMDAAPADSTVVAELRAKGAIVYAKANQSEYGGSNPGGDAAASSRFLGDGHYSSWGGVTCNPYDTERVPWGSSSGSAVSVAANLVTCSICETTMGSCRSPAAWNDVVTLKATKGLIPFGGVFGDNPYLDRAGIMCRTVKDAALVLDALKDPARGYFDPRDIYAALPKGLISKEPYSTFIVEHAGKDAGRKPLAGVRVGIIREYMLKEVPNQAAISDQVNEEIQAVLRDKLGASIVESVDPLYPDDPAIPNMRYTFQRAIAEILPLHMPEYFSKRTGAGALEFAVPGYDVTSRDYMVKASRGQAPLSERLNLRRITSYPENFSFSFAMAQYLLDRHDARVTDWASLNAHAKFFSDARRATMANWEHKVDIRSEGITEEVKLREVLRLVLLKVMRENDIDVLVKPERGPVPPSKIGGPSEPTPYAFNLSPLLGIPAIAVPAGFNRVVYEPQFALSPDKTSYRPVTGTARSLLPHPMPIGMGFWGGPGDEPILLKVASAYEGATHHRVPPPAFGPLPGER